MSWGRSAAALHQQLKPIGECPRQSRHAEHVHVTSDDFDRKRNPIQSPAYLRDDRGIGIPELELP